MTIRTATVDGRKATVADMPDGYIKVLFEDGDMWIGAPAKKVKKVDLNWLMKGEADHAAHEASTSLFNLLPQPSQAQRRVGNYKLGHIRLGGLDISIENPQYSIRSGISPDGKQWSSTLQSHYGYIRRTEGSDGDHVDVFVRPEQPEDYQYPVFVIDQKNPDGSFDEHKCMLGWSNEDEAKAAYLANYDKDWDGIQAIRQFTLPEFKRWLAEGDTTKPVMDYVQKVVDLSLLKGGEGSGNFGHAGRPGEVGGSAASGVSEEAKEAIGSYVVAGHRDINQYLRTGKVFGIEGKELTQSSQERKAAFLDEKIAILDSVMKPSAEDMQVERVLRGSTSWSPVFEEDKGFASAFKEKGSFSSWAYGALDREGEYAENSLVVEVRVPKGTPMIDVDKSGVGGYEKGEVILARGMNFHLISESTETRVHPKDVNKPKWLGEKRTQIIHRAVVEAEYPEAKKIDLSIFHKEFTAPTSATSGIAGYDLEHGAKNLYPAPSTHIRQMMRAKAKQRKRKTKT